jgi:glycerol-3-phosphate dehydrogenase (NAD(P)+)
MSDLKNFAVIGSGGWGTALACHIANVKESCLLYSRDPAIAREINSNNTNTKYLENIALPKLLRATTRIEDLKSAGCIVIATPSGAFVSIIDALAQFNLNPKIPLLIATKGLASDPVQLLSDRIIATLKNPFAFISGPNFAKEVAKYQFSAATISSADLALAGQLKLALESDYFEVTICQDTITTQISGIVKNIVAVKNGMLNASGGGENASAWLITKGLQEIALIAKELGGRPETLLEPGVIGDLVLTANSKTSRNTKFGYEFYKNNFSKKFLDSYPSLVEGVEAARLIGKLVDVSKLNLPIISSVIEKVTDQNF